MPTDRSRDRHARDPDGRPLKPARIWRPDPPELWDQLGAAVGQRKRTRVLSDLIRRFLRGEPMPSPDDYR